MIVRHQFIVSFIQYLDSNECAPILYTAKIELQIKNQIKLNLEMLFYFITRYLFYYSDPYPNIQWCSVKLADFNRY